MSSKTPFTFGYHPVWSLLLPNISGWIVSQTLMYYHIISTEYSEPQYSKLYKSLLPMAEKLSTKQRCLVQLICFCSVLNYPSWSIGLVVVVRDNKGFKEVYKQWLSFIYFLKRFFTLYTNYNEHCLTIRLTVMHDIYQKKSKIILWSISIKLTQFYIHVK